MTIVLLLAIAILPVNAATVDRVDLVEVNHVYTECAKLQFSQLIFWQRGEVRAWRMLKSDNMRPIKEWGGSGWVTTWMDGERFRQVRSASFKESWTQADVEFEERREFPKEHRRALLFEGR